MLFIVFFLAIYPLIDLLGLVIASVSIGLLAHQAASAAAARQKFSGALDAVSSEATSFLSLGISNFVRMKPVGGYNQSGIDLYINVTDFHTYKNTTVGPNAPLPAPPDILANVYEYTTKSTYEVGPVVSLAAVPFLSQVPGLGKPATLSFYASRAVEHVDGLALAKNSLLSSSGGGGGSNNSSTLDTDPTGGDWNYPNIYQLIAVSGQVVVANDVLIVDAINEKWTVSTAFAGSGENVWVDSRSDGIWSNGSIPYVGLSADGAGMGDLNDGLPSSGLEARAGDAGVAYFAGKFKLNFTPQGSGFVQFRFNDQPGQYGNNLGRQIVRVIVTRPG